MKKAFVSISFGDARSHHIRFLEEAAKFGELHALLWTDEQVRALTGGDPKFPLEERQYFLENIRYVSGVSVPEGELSADELPAIDGPAPDVWVVDEDKGDFCKKNGIEYVVLRRPPKEGLTKRSSTDLRGF